MTGVDAATDASRSADPGRPPEAPPQPAAAAASAPPRRRRVSFSWIAGLALLATLGVTAGLSVITYSLNQHNEHRLLDLQVKQTATVLQALLPGIETPLASAAEIAANSGGTTFRSYMSSYVGSSQQDPFVAAGLWRLSGDHGRQLAHIGQPFVLPAAQTEHILAAGARNNSVMLVGPLAPAAGQPRLGYTYAAQGYVVYAESDLPPHRRAKIEAGSPFSDLRFALYLGRSAAPQALLETNVDVLPVPGDTAQVTVPFGSSSLTLVAGSTRHLGGGLLAALWWIVVIVGVVLAALIAVTAERLVRRRREAEGVTAETRVELAEQRSIAQTLQHALLPTTLPDLPGLRVDARYVTGVDGIDIGGDWYDLLRLDDQRLFFVIGDVSGRGVPAGTTMAALRFAIRGYVHEKHPPATVLERLVGIIDVSRDGQFATILCGVLDVDRHEITVASAGHLPPLVIGADAASYVEVPVGPPIGVSAEREYQAVTVRVPTGATLLAFTDGLVERPGQTLDASLQRLRSTVGSATSLTEAFELVMPALIGDSTDDIAILGVQWLS